MTRIVQLTPYPLKSPRHGGQLRCAAIRACYEAHRIDVQTIAAMHEDAYRNERGGGDIALSAALSDWQPQFPRFVDLQAGTCLANDDRAYAVIAHALDRFRPQAIQLEQPWLYPAVRRWLDEREFNESTRPRLIYSSHNIEWKLKRDEQVDDARNAGAYAREIASVRTLEHDVVRAADLVIACTDEELTELRTMAGDSEGSPRIYVTARNAISPFSAQPERLAGIRSRLGIDRYALFVGSAHPPNSDGFWEMVAPSLAFLRPDDKIVVAGGVGHLLRSHRIYQAWPGINDPRLSVLGEIERADLDALLYGASAIVLPITTGGGSNLKTAEAIYSGRPVLATPHALRGYGDVSRWQSVKVAGTPSAFRSGLAQMLKDAPTMSSATHLQCRHEMTWEYSLKPLGESFHYLVASTGGLSTNTEIRRQ